MAIGGDIDNHEFVKHFQTSGISLLEGAIRVA